MFEFTPARLAELRAVAEAATPGEWSEKRVRAWGDEYAEVQPLYEVIEMTDSDPAHACAYPPEPEDAAHIATFSPPTVLALIAALEAKTAEAEAGVETERELNWKGQEFYARADRAEAALERVKALHHDAGESQGYTSDVRGGYGMIPNCCASCGSFGEYGEPWPCATIRAIEGADDD